MFVLVKMNTVETVDDVTILVFCNSVFVKFATSTNVLTGFTSSLILHLDIFSLAILGVVVTLILKFKFSQEFLLLGHQGVPGELGSAQERIVVNSNSAVASVGRTKGVISQ